MENIQLPQHFLDRMRAQLGDEFEAFLASYDKPYRSALRINALKLDEAEPCVDTTMDDGSFDCEYVKQMLLSSGAVTGLEPVPWCKEGFYYGESDRPGKHPLHDAGLYYIQEPSAMSVAAKAEAKPGMRVLDLCAAPGGKTTALAAAMQGEGLLVANEIMPARAKVLSQNVERMGIRNCIVTNESPAELASHFPMFFDLIVVDAPCSGEGMFRKEPDALTCWSEANVSMCANRQREILTSALSMLASGGRLVYSTCTFAEEEDEEIVSWLTGAQGYSNSKQSSDIVDDITATDPITHLRVISTEKFYPHKLDGEGHFVAVLQDVSEAAPREASSKSQKKKARLDDLVITWNDVKPEIVSEDFIRKLEGFVSEKKDVSCENVSSEKDDFISKSTTSGHHHSMANIPQSNLSYVTFGDNLYLMPEEIDLRGLKVLRPGLQLGEVRKGRFIPSHALALALTPEEAAQSVDLSVADAAKFIAGEELPTSAAKKITIGDKIVETSNAAESIYSLSGWTLVTTCGVSLGWAKASNGRLKNHFPKGLRHN